MNKLFSFNKNIFVYSTFATLIFIVWMTKLSVVPDASLFERSIVTALSQIGLFGLALFVGIANWKHLGAKNNPSKAVLYIGIACGLFALAQIVWLEFNLRGLEAPYPSIADPIWILMLPFMVIAIGHLLTTYKILLTRRVVLESILVFALVLLAYFYFIGRPEISADLPFAENFFNVAYIVSDAIYLGAIFAAIRIVGGRFYRGYMVTLFALFIHTIGDLLFAYRTAQDIYFNSDISDIFYTLSAYLFIVAMILISTSVKRSEVLTNQIS